LIRVFKFKCFFVRWPTADNPVSFGLKMISNLLLFLFGVFSLAFVKADRCDQLCKFDSTDAQDCLGNVIVVVVVVGIL
jgi:hypothetical protein